MQLIMLMPKNIEHPYGVFACCVFLDQLAIRRATESYPDGSCSMSKSVMILNDEGDENRENDEVKASSACEASPSIY